MLFALAGSDGDPGRRLVIVGDRLLRHRNEEVEWCGDALQIRDCRAVHHILRVLTVVRVEPRWTGCDRQPPVGLCESRRLARGPRDQAPPIPREGAEPQSLSADTA